MAGHARPSYFPTFSFSGSYGSGAREKTSTQNCKHGTEATFMVLGVFKVSWCFQFFVASINHWFWSMYRVCLSCDAKKQCFLCQTKQTKEYFSHVAWQTRDPKRRLCLQCQTKTRGSWKCAVCHQRRSRHQFSYFISRRPSGKDGTQTCNTCHAAKVQHAVRKRAAASSIARLEPLRKRLRHRQIIQETWEAIARKHSRTTIPVEKCVRNTAVPALSQRKPVYEYIRPHCKTQVRSTVTDGQVDAKQQHCGVRFRVRSGTVIQSFFTHQCPSCLTEVQSTKRFGRIQVAHKKSNGKRYATKCWQVVCSGTKDTT